LVPVFFTTTWALGMAALFVSVMRPVMVARKSCAADAFDSIDNSDRETSRVIKIRGALII
jgi:hypothetical protein